MNIKKNVGHSCKTHSECKNGNCVYGKCTRKNKTRKTSVKLTNENKMFIVGKKFNTDKVTHHEYHKIYDFFLQDLYNKKGSILEIGIEYMKSINMWLELFPNAFIYGIDINFKKNGDRYEVFKADQSKTNELNLIKKKLENKNLFFINDDGSHIPEHQLLTFNILFPLLDNNGIYIIEDIETSYWTKKGLYGYPTNYGYKHDNSIIEIFKSVADAVNSEFAGEHPSKVRHLDYIDSITFSRNCIIIRKQEKREQITYRFKNRL